MMILPPDSGAQLMYHGATLPASATHLHHHNLPQQRQQQLTHHHFHHQHQLHPHHQQQQQPQLQQHRAATTMPPHQQRVAAKIGHEATVALAHHHHQHHQQQHHQHQQQSQQHFIGAAQFYTNSSSNSSHSSGTPSPPPAKDSGMAEAGQVTRPKTPQMINNNNSTTSNQNLQQHQDSTVSSGNTTGTNKSEPELNIEFDGTTVLCRVCGDKASGFHYGVHSCEGCKGFFRRSIQQKIQYRPCTKNQQCSILRINRNRCQYCRLKKCIAVGMSRDAVRFGRVPKREKARILAAMQQSSYSRSQEKAVAAELEDEQRLLQTVVRAHIDTCDFTRDKVAPVLARARETPSYTACPPTLACPLNPNPQPLTGQQELLQDFSKRFSPAIRGVVEFAKRIPGFGLLAQDDQVTLLKAGVFEVLLVRLACMFDAQTASMVCLNGQVLKRESIHNSSNARFLMDSMFDFAERVNALRLSDAELGLFCSVVVIAADRPGLRNLELVERMNGKLRTALQTVLQQNHPQQPEIMRELLKKIPDLRTLNTLHSEKLLAFKMTEQQQQLQAQQQAQQQQAHSVQQQQQQQQQQWPMDEEPSGSWSTDACLDEAVKSPLGSVSSTESTCSNEVASLSDYQLHHHHHHHHHVVSPVQSHHASSAPLLAATLAGGLCPHRRRANSGSTSSGEDELQRAKSALLLVQSSSSSNSAASSSSSSSGSVGNSANASAGTVGQNGAVTSQCPRFRKLDSPSDSGIESGTEVKPCATDHLKPTSSSSTTGSAPTSVCSSPRSDEKDAVEDMPVLKRVLQAPPLYDTNSLMDEAYKPHKKFRALRQKDSAEAEPAIVVSHYHSNGTTSGAAAGPAQHYQSQAQAQQQQQQQPQPPQQPSPQPQPSPVQSQLHLHLTSPPAPSTPSQSQQCPQMASLLSSKHSTLAKSLMEGPKMTAEQMKRTDIIHSYIMRAEASPRRSSPSPPEHQCASTTSTSSARSSPLHQHHHHHQHHQQQLYSSRWPATSVITTTTGVLPRPSQQQQTQGEYGMMLGHSSPASSPRYMSAAATSSTSSPSPRPSSSGSAASSTTAGLAVPERCQSSNSMVELQVDIADSQQPLNLSKKSPSPSPRPAPALVQVQGSALGKAVSMEA